MPLWYLPYSASVLTIINLLSVTAHPLNWVPAYDLLIGSASSAFSPQSLARINMFHRSLLPCAFFLASALSTPFLQQGSVSQAHVAANTPSGVPGVNATFDYVIVGGGTAGLTLASRLARDQSLSVAVIEAGGYYEADNGNLSVVPGYCTAYAGTDPSLTNPHVDWGFVTVPQAVSTERVDPRLFNSDTVQGCKWKEAALRSR